MQPHAMQPYADVDVQDITNTTYESPCIPSSQSQCINQPIAMQPHADVDVQMDHQNQTLVKTKNKTAKSTLNLSKHSASLDPTRHTVVNLDESAQYTSNPSSRALMLEPTTCKTVEVGKWTC